MARYETVLTNTFTGERVVIRSNDYTTLQSRIAKKRQVWAQQHDRAQARINKENAIAEADQRTEEALHLIDQCRSILSAGVDSISRFDWSAYWSSKYDHHRFEPFKPEPQPIRATYFTNVPKKSFWELFYPPKKRFRESMETIAANHYERACRVHEESERERRQVHDRESLMFVARQAAQNDKVSTSRKLFEAGASSEVDEFLREVLGKSQYPEGIELDYDPRFITAQKLVAVDVELPPPDALPTLAEVRYVKSKGEYTEKHLKKSEVQELYNETIAQITIRTLYEIFRALYTNCAQSVLFNGFVTAVDPATGQARRICIVAIGAERPHFSSLNLKQVSAQQCLSGLGADFSGEFSELNPVPPRLPPTGIPPAVAKPSSPKLSAPNENPNSRWVSFAEVESSPVPVPKPVLAGPGPALPKTIPNYGPRPYFAGIGSTVRAAALEISDPLIYVADCDQVRDADASLLCLKRHIEPPRAEPPKSLGYWPQLSELQPYQVGNYLQWLATGRSNPEVDLGYVFLYFYGLERRALVEGQDILPIAQEVVRLIGIYGQSRSFRGYATGLIAHLVMIGRLKPTQKLLTKMLNAQEDFIESELQALLLGFLAREQQPLSAEWAMKLAAQDERAKRSVVTKKAPEEISRLFSLKYQERFKDGIIPAAGAREENIRYRAASPSLLNGTTTAALVPIAKWPGVQGWRRQFNPVVDLWNNSLDELRDFAKKAGTVGRNSADAYEALPEPLRQESSHPLKTAWDTLLAEFSPDEGVLLLPVSRLSLLRGIEQRSKLSMAQSRDLAELAEIMGTPLEPDARFLGKAYRWDEHVAALRLPEEPVAPQGKNYHLAGLILNLAAEIARADGNVDENERKTITEFIRERFQLNWNDGIRLNGLLACILRDQTPLTGLKKVLASQLDRPQKIAICQFLISIAAASGGIAGEEVRALERTYKALDLDPSLVEQHLVDLGHRQPESPVLVSQENGDTGEIIPPPSTLNLERIRQLRTESDEVAKMLVAAMTDKTFDEEEAEVESSHPSPSIALAKPPPRAEARPANSDGPRAIIIELVVKRSWPLPEFAAMARKHGRSAAAAVEIINEWSDENLGDLLIEDGDPLTINLELWERAGKTT